MLIDRSSKTGPKKGSRPGAAAAEFAICLPLILLILTGLWEVGRCSEVAVVMWNSAREAARDASLGQDNLQAVATNLLTYLQGAEPTAFGQGHSTSMISPVITLPSNTYGYTCWDNTANRELVHHELLGPDQYQRDRPDSGQPARRVSDQRVGTLQEYRHQPAQPDHRNHPDLGHGGLGVDAGHALPDHALSAG